MFSMSNTSGFSLLYPQDNMGEKDKKVASEQIVAAAALIKNVSVTQLTPQLISFRKGKNDCCKTTLLRRQTRQWSDENDPPSLILRETLSVRQTFTLQS